MPFYASPGSSIVYYEVLYPFDEALLPEGILVEFEDGSVYRWLSAGVGQAAIDTMVELAEQNSGLGSWIYQNVRYDYS